MKKQSILTVGILFILSVVCFLYISNRNKNGVSDQFPWAKTRKDALISLELSDLRPNSLKKFVLSKENGVWGVFKPIYYATSPDRIAIFSTTFMNLSPKNIFTNVSPEEYNAYGLNNPQMRLTSKIKGSADTTLILGTSATLGGDVYTAIEGIKDVVYLIPAVDAETILGGLSGLLNNAPFNTEYGDGTEVLIRNMMDENWDFIKTNGFWELLPSMETNKDWGMRRLLQQAKDFRFETNTVLYDITPSDLSNLGINTNTSPYFKVREGNGSNYSIFIGAEKDGFYQAYIPEMQIGTTVSSVLAHQLFHTSLKDLAATRRR